jgi:hypothetical protein
VDQIDRGIMAFEHDNFDDPLPPTINYANDRGKYVVSCFDDRCNWAYQFFEWANNLSSRDTKTKILEIETEDEESVSSDEVAITEDDSVS